MNNTDLVEKLTAAFNTMYPAVYAAAHATIELQETWGDEACYVVNVNGEALPINNDYLEMALNTIDEVRTILANEVK